MSQLQIEIISSLLAEISSEEDWLYQSLPRCIAFYQDLNPTERKDFLKASKASSSLVQKQLASLLAHLQDKESLEILEELLFTEDVQVSTEAISAICQRVHEQGKEAVVFTEVVLLRIETLQVSLSPLMQDFIEETLELAGVYP